MAEIKYVDWDGLVYYDGKSKQYINDIFDQTLKFGGSYTVDSVPSPGVETLNFTYKITDKFVVSPESLLFVDEVLNHEFAAGTLIVVVDAGQDIYKFDILFEAVSGIPHTPDGIVDLTNYYTKDEIDLLLQKLPTVEYVNSTISAATENLVTNDQLDAIKELIPDVSNFITEIPEEYVTAEELDGKGYLTEHQDLSEYAKKSDIPSIEGLATEEFVTAKIAEAELNDKDVDLDAYYTKTEVDALIPETSEFVLKEELEGFATEEFVATAISAIEIPEADLSNYYNKSETENIVNEAIGNIDIPEVPTNVSEFTNDAQYTTLEEVATVGYITEVPSDDSKVDKDAYDADKATFALKDDIPTDYLTEESLEGYAKTTDLPDVSNLASKDELIGLASEEFVTTAINAIEIPDISDCAKESDLDVLEETVNTLDTAVSMNTTAVEELQEAVEDNTTAISLINENITSLEGEIADLKTATPNLDNYVTTEILTRELETKANTVLFVEDYRVNTPVGEFTTGESVQNLTIDQIVTKLLGLTLYVPPTTDVPEGTPESAVDVMDKEYSTYVLGESGEQVELAYSYTTMTPEEAKKDNQQDSYFYQIIDPNTGAAVESGYQIATIYQENDYLTVYIPNSVTKFHVKEYSALAGDWSQPTWNLVENSNYTMDGYTAYTVDAEILSGITVRIVIEE